MRKSPVSPTNVRHKTGLDDCKEDGTSLEDKQRFGKLSVQVLAEMVEPQPRSCARIMSVELGPSQRTIN